MVITASRDLEVGANSFPGLSIPAQLILLPCATIGSIDDSLGLAACGRIVVDVGVKCTFEDHPFALVP